MKKQAPCSFECVYRDVKHAYQTNTELFKANSEKEVLSEFIRKRRLEQWSLGEIFTKSRLSVINKETGRNYSLNEYGELAASEYKSF